MKNPKQTQEKDSLKTLRVSKISQKDSFQQRWSQIFLLCLNFDRLFFCIYKKTFKNISFLQDQHSQHIVGHFGQCEMSLHKRIYGLEILDGQMDLPILSELQEVGQRRNFQNSLVICRQLSFVNEDLQVLFLLFVVHSEQLYDLFVPNALPCLV